MTIVFNAFDANYINRDLNGQEAETAVTVINGRKFVLNIAQMSTIGDWSLVQKYHWTMHFCCWHDSKPHHSVTDIITNISSPDYY